MAYRPQTENNLIFNQSEIDSFDMHIWRNERRMLHGRVEKFCTQNKITFSQFALRKDIQLSRHKVIVWMWLFDPISDYEYWVKINQCCQQYDKTVLVLTDNIVNFANLSNVEFFSYPELLGITCSNINVTVNTNPSKLYNCFIQRVCSVRQSWFYFLHFHGLLDKGYVSLLLKQLKTYSSLTGKELFDYNHHEFKLNQLPHFEKSYRELRDQVPYRNFTETNNLLPLMCDSKYSVVIETAATDDDKNKWCYTEKSLRTLQLPTIPLLFIQRQGISKLRGLGFEFSAVADHIDQLPWQERQQQILQILIHDTFDIDFKELYNQSQHNRGLLQSWKNSYNKENFFDNFYTKALSL